MYDTERILIKYCIVWNKNEKSKSTEQLHSTWINVRLTNDVVAGLQSGAREPVQRRVARSKKFTCNCPILLLGIDYAHTEYEFYYAYTLALLLEIKLNTEFGALESCQVLLDTFTRRISDATIDELLQRITRLE